MTVQTWIASRTPSAPAELWQEILHALGADAQADETRTADVCLQAADRTLRALIRTRRFDREGALGLLTVDALVTYAYEYASAAPLDDLTQQADRGVSLFGAIAAADV